MSAGERKARIVRRSPSMTNQRVFRTVSSTHCGSSGQGGGATACVLRTTAYWVVSLNHPCETRIQMDVILCSQVHAGLVSLEPLLLQFLILGLIPF